jgi:hypothetical protein
VKPGAPQPGRVHCHECKRPFALSPKQATFLTESVARGMSFICLECPLCGLGISLRLKKVPPPKEKRQFRCPLLGCDGWVDWIDHLANRPFWGCGHCGTRWPDEAKLFAAITKVVERQPYRATVYRDMRGGRWGPVPPSKQPDWYEAQAETDPVPTAPRRRRR